MKLKLKDRNNRYALTFAIKETTLSESTISLVDLEGDIELFTVPCERDIHGQLLIKLEKLIALSMNKKTNKTVVGSRWYPSKTKNMYDAGDFYIAPVLVPSLRKVSLILNQENEIGLPDKLVFDVNIHILSAFLEKNNQVGKSDLW